MAVFYRNEVGDRDAIYRAAEKWKEECLLNDRSLIWDGEQVWTEDNIHRFRKIFIERPDESGDSFDDKLKKQLEDESESVYKFVIELMFIYYMFPDKRSISFKTKMKKIETIASWKGIEVDSSLPIFDGLKDGLGSPGTYFLIGRYFELSFTFQLVEALKKKPLDARLKVLENHQALKAEAEEIRKGIGKRVQMFHIVLHLLLPKHFEAISSWGHKDKIVKTYKELIEDAPTNDKDEQLFIIREKLEEKYAGDKFDFYLPEVVKEWNETKKPPIRETDKKDEVPAQPPQNNVDFNVTPLSDGLVFENIDLLLDQVMTALSKGKHIILTGPPGTGKSKLASKICEMYGVESTMVTAASNWSTYETIGGYRPDREGNLYFDDGIFLKCFKDKATNQQKNNWLIIDEINRADIDKAFGSLFSVLTGDEVTLPFEGSNGKPIVLKPQQASHQEEVDSSTYTVPEDWRIIATMNTIDKASLYEMSYAFMRRFAFIPVGVPKEISPSLVEDYLHVWEMENYPHTETLATIWKLINQYRKIGPAIIEDIARHTEDNDDFNSAIILYVLPQFEGLPLSRINEFVSRLIEATEAVVDEDLLHSFITDFFDAGGLE